LARYSSDNTTLRELLQNADDANATSVKIQYLTLSGRRIPPEELGATPCRRLQVSNNGVPFRDEDWKRLKRIAEGNPDEEKIGAFGVGFYSVFSICENPFVSSGNQCMAFFWERDQLFVRRRALPKDDKMTTFMLNMRSPTEIPNLVCLRFRKSNI
jgi:HSP90 family molecular chaperone